MTKIPSQIPTNLEEVDKYAVGDKLNREEMAKLWSTKDILGHVEQEILVWHHRLNHCSPKYLLELSKRGIIPKELSNLRISSLVSPAYLVSTKRGHEGPKANYQAGRSGSPRRPDPGP